ncbi:hypothetical protein F4561_006469 [Lipingzhangella halophila]|uniref:Uncharacterized protein n=1 Tax=Lipingzhangella halophila TaxID=1783352 RepID=A0A7W7RP45_9ACTN|nr:hypothetical protein [Lipingzhangella halophila]MBB4935575.1 hypothetical protein [Lipingzhangella halophila]
MPQIPSRHEVVAVFEALLDGRMTRDEAERWAGQRVADDTQDPNDPAVWKALDQLYGIDLRHGPEQPFLHSRAQVFQWLDQLRNAP